MSEDHSKRESLKSLESDELELDGLDGLEVFQFRGLLGLTWVDTC